MILLPTHAAFHWLINCVAKVEDLQHDIHVTRETFERIVDRKDAILRSLSQDIEEAEEQYPPLAAAVHGMAAAEQIAVSPRRFAGL